MGGRKYTKEGVYGNFRVERPSWVRPRACQAERLVSGGGVMHSSGLPHSPGSCACPYLFKKSEESNWAQRVPVCEQPCKSPGSTCTMRCLARAVYNWGHSNRTCSTVWGSPPHSHLTISSVIDLSNGVPSCGVSPLGKWYPRSRAALTSDSVPLPLRIVPALPPGDRLPLVLAPVLERERSPQVCDQH